MPTTPAFSVIVSAWNEEKNIENVIRSVAAATPAAEIVVVHGGTDRTLEIAKTLQAEFPQVVAVRNENDRGKGHGIKTGIARASGNYMAQFDADLQFFATDLPALVQPLLDGKADVCVGSRFLPSSDWAAYKPSFFRDMGNRVLSAYISVLIGQKVTNVTTGMKAWTRGAIQEIDFRDERYSYEAEIVVRAGLLRQRIVEVPVSYASRSEGESMHRSNLAVIRAGLVIMRKCFACWMRSLFTRKK